MPNPFVHIELATDDVSLAKKFYKALFDWKLSDMQEMGYTMVDVGQGTGGGMMKKPMAEAPTAWLPYVAVDSVKKTVEKAKKAGGSVIVEYQPVPGMGAFGIVVDPTGGTIGLWEMARPEPKAEDEKPAAKKKSAKKKSAKKKSAKKKEAAPEPAKAAPKKAAAKKAAKKKPAAPEPAKPAAKPAKKAAKKG